MEAKHPLDEAALELFPALVEALKEAVEDLVDFARSRGSEYEGTEDDLVGRYRTAISQAEGGE